MDDPRATPYLLNKVEKQLIKLNIGLKSVKQLDLEIQTLLNDIDELKKEAELTKPEEKIRQTVSKQSLIFLFKETKEQYYDAIQLLEKYQDLLEQAGLFFEKYRDYRYYSFTTNKDYAKFLQNTLDSQKTNEIWAKADIQGSFKLDQIANKLALQAENNSYIKVPKNKIENLLEEVEKTNPQATLKIESYPYSFVWKPKEYIRADAPTRQIKEIDAIATKSGATIMPL